MFISVILLFVFFCYFDHCFEWIIVLPSARLGQFIFVFLDRTEICLFFDAFMFFLLIPRPLMEYCSSLCTFGSVYFF